MVTNAEFKHIRAWFTLYVTNSNTVLTNLRQSGMTDIYIYIRINVTGRIMYFVQELFFDRLLTNNTSAGGSLCYYEIIIVITDFRNWKSELIHIGHTAPIVLIVASRTLPSTFQQMTNHDASGQIIPIICFPTQFIHARSKKHSRIRCTSSNCYIGTLFKAFCDRLITKIYVRIQNFVLNVFEITNIIDVFKVKTLFQELGNLCLNIIAQNIPDFVAMHFLLFGHLFNSINSSLNVHSACI